MSEILSSKTHQKIVNEMSAEALEALSDQRDGTCTTGYDNDGSTGYDIFENGFELCAKAAGRQVWQLEHPHEYQAWFLIGTEEEVTERLHKIVEEAKTEEVVEA